MSADSPVSVSYNAWAVDGTTRRAQRLLDHAGRRLGLLPAAHAMPREHAAASVEAVAVALASAVARLPSATEARQWISERMRARWRPMLERYPRGLIKLQRFCAAGEAADARAAMGAAHMPPEVTARVAEAASTLDALRVHGAHLMECANAIEQLALDVLGDARTAGSFLVHCFDDGMEHG